MNASQPKTPRSNEDENPPDIIGVAGIGFIASGLVVSLLHEAEIAMGISAFVLNFIGLCAILTSWRVNRRR